MKRTTVVDSVGLEIEWVRRGDVIKAPALDTGEDGPFMAVAPCADLFHVYYCVTCLVSLANAGNIEIHVEKGGYHQIARWCEKRNLFEAAEPIALNIEARA